MTTVRCFVFGAMVLLGLSTSAFGQVVFVNPAEVVGATPTGDIPAGGGDVLIPVRFSNETHDCVQISNGYEFVSFGEVEYALMRFKPRGIPFDPPGEKSFVTADCYTSSGLPMFDQVTVCYFDGGGGVSAAADLAGTGLPAGFNDVAYEIELIGVNGTPGAQLILDSASREPDLVWFWSGVGTAVDWGGPYVFTLVDTSPEPYTTCWPQPVELGVNDNDGVLRINIFNEDPTVVNLASVRVFSKIPPFTQDIAWVEDGVIVTDCSLKRFLGTGGFRPLPDESFVGEYTVTYVKNDDEYVSLTGEFAMTINKADVNCDGSVGPDDVDFMMDYFSGKVTVETIGGFAIEEILDVDRNGRVDPLDLSALSELVY